MILEKSDFFSRTSSTEISKNMYNIYKQVKYSKTVK